ncbi:uncharacterized protein BDW70DRAFT_119832 [Aspergillus foveolatus]|uniref:uncharacterized protein n=1 Tax=Aspergillus foveolatus TaxID=210207 RepID=UPI003CCD2FDD
MDLSSQQSLVRHKTLDTILSQEIQEIMTSTYSEMESYYPEYIFIEMLAQPAVLVLFTAGISAQQHKYVSCLAQGVIEEGFHGGGKEP